MRRGELSERFDAKFHLPEHEILLRRMENSGYPLHLVGSRDISTQVVDGPFGSDLKVDDYQPAGIPLIRVSNCRTGTIVADDDLVFISPEKHAELIRSEVLPGDVLLTKAGHILGYTAVFPDFLERGNITSHLASIRPANGVLPAYLAEYLTSSIGISQIYRWGNKSTRPELNTDEVRALKVVLPARKKQRELVDAMEAARAKRRAKFAEADALLASLDGYLLDELHLAFSPTPPRTVFSVARESVAGRLDPHFYSPQFVQIERLLIAARAEPLRSLAQVSHEMRDPSAGDEPSFRYIEISNVRPDTGEAAFEEIPASGAPSRARMVVRAGDILVSLTRPHHGSIAQISEDLDGCIASTGFAVLREFDKERVVPDFLWCMLRSRLSLQQMLQRSSGGNYPAITEAELAKVLVPVPSREVQSKIATEIRSRRERARMLRAQAESGWAEAKRWFEEQLLGPAGQPPA